MARAIGELPNGVIVWRSKWEGEIDIPLFGNGARERARRRRQILAGTLTRDNGFEGGLAAYAAARSEEPVRIITAGGHNPAADPGFFERLRKKLAA